MGSYAAVNVQCPFYRDDDGKSRITCEGLADKSYITLRYEQDIDWKWQMAHCCQDRYGYLQCGIYKALIEKEEYQ